MTRRNPFRMLAAAAILVGPAPVISQPSALATALRNAADSAMALARSPGSAGSWGDQSDSTRIRQYARIDRVNAMLRAIDASSLNSTDERLLLANLIEVNAGSAGLRVCRNHLWNAPSAFSGWHIASSNWARNVRVGDDASRDRALAALRELPMAIATEQSLLQRGLDSGVVSSAQVIAGVVKQIGDLVPDAIAASPLAAPVARDSSAAFRESYVTVLRNSVYPAANAYAQWLQNVYLPRARIDGSLRTLQNGDSCYRAIMRSSTSITLDPQSLMSEARGEVDRIHTLLRPLIASETGARDIAVADGIRTLKSDARFTFASRDSVLIAHRNMTQLASTRIGRVVAGFQPESIVVIGYPEFQEKAGVPPSYQRAPDDRSRPATFLVNLSRPERMAVGNASAHEAYPGHHLQRIAASQATSIHPVMRTLSVGAFSEGWGIYSEDLGAEMGLYTTKLDSIGHLVHLLDVAVAYYLDVGAHVHGWNRATLIDSMYVLGGRTRQQASDYADRHAGTPGQLATYYFGYRAIRTARATAERQLGAKFDLASFNREVIRHGTITLASLQANLDGWIRERSSGTGGTRQ